MINSKEICEAFSTLKTTAGTWLSASEMRLSLTSQIRKLIINNEL